MRSLALITLLGIAGSTSAAVLNVPEDFGTIQEAIISAEDGDRVEVAPGVYSGEGNVNLDFLQKSISLFGVSGPEVTSIDCQNGSRAFDLSGDRAIQCSIEGFTVMNADPGGGYPSGNGGAMRLSGLTLTLENCVFTQNRSGYHGGAIWLNHSDMIIRGCSFVENQAPSGPHAHAGAILVQDYCNVLIEDSSFIGNIAHENAGALFVNGSDDVQVVNSLFSGNTASTGSGAGIYAGGPVHAINLTLVGNHAGSGTGGGICVSDGASQLTLENSIIAFSTAGEAIYSSDPGNTTILCSDLYGNLGGDWTGNIAGQHGSAGNISENPLICDFEFANYSLETVSPCAPANNECGVLIGSSPVGCSTQARNSTWGKVKASF